MKSYRKIFLSVLISALISIAAFTQIQDWPDDEVAGIKVNYTEAKVPHYTLPDPLTLKSGERVTDIQAWNERRRPEILQLFEDYPLLDSKRRKQAVQYLEDFYYIINHDKLVQTEFFDRARIPHN